mmetsp:Transcript_2086/g.5302  ORF Transcript_2086/g.5302 Transcript_2086/m.5302 type:complete len:159 (-) Transcript_2086:9-485(-)
MQAALVLLVVAYASSVLGQAAQEHAKAMGMVVEFKSVSAAYDNVVKSVASGGMVQATLLSRTVRITVQAAADTVIADCGAANTITSTLADLFGLGPESLTSNIAGNASLVQLEVTCGPGVGIVSDPDSNYRPPPLAPLPATKSPSQGRRLLQNGLPCG